MGVANALMIAGTSSGAGKTSITLALCRAITRMGKTVAPFKVGPDFLDPTYLSAATGNHCHNLDSWMMGGDYMKKLFKEKSATADIALVEGVMGLFDGVSVDDLEGSSADVARQLNLPVLLVVNGKGMSRSIAPLVKGFAEFHPEVKIAGVIANHIGSDSHRKWLQDSLEAANLPPLVGAIPKNGFTPLPSRHLGLRTADSQLKDSSLLDEMADVIEQYSDIKKIMQIANISSPKIVPENMPKKQAEGVATSPRKTRLAVAMDKAFHFYYHDNLSALEQQQCELCFFSPLADDVLPDGVHGLYIGGGYPEEYASELAGNKTMLASIKEFAKSKPVYGECGGLVYLSNGVELLDGSRHSFVGLLPAFTKMNSRYKSLGYVEAEFLENSLFGCKGALLRGHRFHYSELMDEPAGLDGWRKIYNLKGKRNAVTMQEGYSKGATLLSYAHLHFASGGNAAKHFVERLNSI